jgi:FkbM family methyltransferase
MRESGLKRVFRGPWLLFRKGYHRIFARPSMQRFNDRILDVALRAHGYNNYCDLKTTGEETFVKLLATYDPKFCLDIGANKGAYSELLLERTGARVLGFEPLPKAYEILGKLRNKYPGRFEAINKGVSDRAAVLQLHYGSEDSEWASFSTEVSKIGYVGLHNVNVINAAVITLDSHFGENPSPYKEIDLLKIDTEGYEYEVLVGARNTIATLRPKFIQIEYNLHQLFRAHSLFALSELLPNYQAYQLLPFGRALARRDVTSPEANVYQYSNFVFVRQDLQV